MGVDELTQRYYYDCDTLGLNRFKRDCRKKIDTCDRLAQMHATTFLVGSDELDHPLALDSREACMSWVWRVMKRYHSGVTVKGKGFQKPKPKAEPKPPCIGDFIHDIEDTFFLFTAFRKPIYRLIEVWDEMKTTETNRIAAIDVLRKQRDRTFNKYPPFEMYAAGLVLGDETVSTDKARRFFIQARQVDSDYYQQGVSTALAWRVRYGAHKGKTIKDLVGVSATPPPCELTKIDFATGAALSTEAKKILDANIMCLEALAYPKVTITGHSDHSGSTDASMRMSRRRATAVERYFRAHGVPPETITVEAKGETELDQRFSPDSTMQRRVEMVIE